jgi:hypothetical protein
MKTLKNSFSLLVVSTLFLTTGCTCTINSDQPSIGGNREYVAKERTVDSFSSLVVKGSFNVVIEQGAKPMVIVDTDSNLHQYIYTEVVDGQLVISQPQNRDLRSIRTIRVKVYYQDLKEIEMLGSTELTGNGVLQFDTIKLSGAGAIKANLELKGNFIEGEFPGAASIKLSGNVDQATFDFPGAVKLTASELKTRNFSISMAGAGKAKVNVKEELNVQIAGAGLVSYRGNPSKVVSSIGGIGKLMNEEND